MIKNRIVSEKIEKIIFSENNKILVLLGARQVGKTTIMKYFFQLLKQKQEKTIFLDMDVYENYEKIETYEKFLNFMVLNGYQEKQKEIFYVFLDEFQKYSDFTKILKNIYDNHKNIKIIVSGSSCLSIKNNIQESLAGRKRIINIFPLCFEEFLVFKDKTELVAKLSNIKNLKGKGLYSSLIEYYTLLEEFMIYGGYPQVVLENDFEEKQKILGDIFDLFVKKDLGEYLKMDKIKIANDVLKYIAINNGTKIKYEEIAKISNTSIHTIKNYIQILKELFVFVELRPYFTNKNLELVKIPKIYFLDNGVRNYFIKNFISTEFRQDIGTLFEGFFIQELVKKGLEIETLKYWNDKNKREVDIIIDNISEISAYELKYKKNIKSEDLLGLKTFEKVYSVRGSLVNLDIQEEKNGINYILPFKE